MIPKGTMLDGDQLDIEAVTQAGPPRRFTVDDWSAGEAKISNVPPGPRVLLMLAPDQLHAWQTSGLAAAICAEGYRIMQDVRSGKIVLERSNTGHPMANVFTAARLAWLEAENERLQGMVAAIRRVLGV